MQNLGGGGRGANKVHYGRYASDEYLNSISHLHGVIVTQLTTRPWKQWLCTILEDKQGVLWQCEYGELVPEIL